MSKDSNIQHSLSGILTVVDEYDSEMAELGRPDGNMVDSGTMALLNSGINLSHADSVSYTHLRAHET